MQTVIFDTQGRAVEAAAYSRPPALLRPQEIEVTAAQHAAWQILRLVDGAVTIDDASALALRQAAARARRDVALRAEEWRVLPHSPLCEAERAEWMSWIIAMRDWPAQPGWPDLAMPSRPGEAV